MTLVALGGSKAMHEFWSYTIWPLTAHENGMSSWTVAYLGAHENVQILGGRLPYTCTQVPQCKLMLNLLLGARTVGGLGSEGDKTVLLEPKNWNPISSSKCTVLARHG